MAKVKRTFIGKRYKLIGPKFTTEGVLINHVISGIAFETKDDKGVDCLLPICNAINGSWKIEEIEE